MNHLGSTFLASAIALSLFATPDVARAEQPAPTDKPAPAAPEVPGDDAAKTLTFFSAMLDTMLANKADCGKMASAIDALVDKNKPLLTRLKGYEKDGRRLPKDAEAKLAERMQRDFPQIEKCLTDPALAAAMKRVSDPSLPPGPSAAVRAQVKAPVAEELAKYEKKIPGKGDLIATITTPQGEIRCQLFADKAPMTVANFVGLATGQKPWLDPKTSKLQKAKPYYNGTIFHRVIPGFMIQGGDPTGTGMGGPGYTFADETSSGLTMEPGVLAMANSGPSTNGSQFFITEGAPTYLNGKHTIFGKCAPLELVTKIANVPRDASDRPNTEVTMKIKISHGKL
ncbi:MAG: peptidylprolyl isomerase [Kofleriaceae bacterium]|nr:peptidylprolyl isomerase [Kofleriaceae bacterium]